MTSNNALTAVLTLALFNTWPLSSVAQTDVITPPPSIHVEYTNPEKFSDVGNSYSGSNETTRATYLEELRKHIQRHASRLLADGQNLTVTIIDVDMAGSFEPWRPLMNDLRIVRDSYPPRIDLYFQLTDTDGAVIKNGKRELRDIAFLMTTIMYHNDPLRHEKTLLDNWLEREFADQ